MLDSTFVSLLAFEDFVCVSSTGLSVFPPRPLFSASSGALHRGKQLGPSCSALPPFTASGKYRLRRGGEVGRTPCLQGPQNPSEEKQPHALVHSLLRNDATLWPGVPADINTGGAELCHKQMHTQNLQLFSTVFPTIFAQPEFDQFSHLPPGFPPIQTLNHGARRH